MKEEKYYYMVVNIADEVSAGYVLLTKEEAELVARVTDKSNWQKAWVVEGYYSGLYLIELNNPIPQEQWKGIRVPGYHMLPDASTTVR